MEYLQGTVEGIYFRNEENGYTVAMIDAEGVQIAVGIMPCVQEGQTVRLGGKWTEHKKYGTQFAVDTFEMLLPQDERELELYLSSGIVSGVGPSTARAIISLYGMDALSALRSPEKLKRVSGIGAARAQVIAESFSENEDMRETMMFFQKYGLSPAKIMSIYKVYGTHSVRMAEEQPYSIIDGVEGIGFKSIDELAKSMGMESSSSQRIRACMKFLLSQAASEGHVYLPADVLARKTAEYLNIDVDILDYIDDLQLHSQAVLEDAPGSPVYLGWCYDAECDTAFRLSRLMRHCNTMPIGDPRPDIAEQECKCGMQLAQRQKEAVYSALENGVFVLTGGPGTGKTTTLNCMIQVLRKHKQEVVLAAPTGRAAKRMTETTGMEAKTIHRLLEYTLTEGNPYFARNLQRQLEGDVFIVDEVSMVDISLMRSLLSAIPEGARLILVGDADQLPSIGPGSVLRDIIESEAVPVVRLDEIFRQQQESLIIVNAHRINKGQIPELNRSDSDFIMVRKNGDEIVDTVVELCARGIPRKFGFRPEDIQVLSPNKKQSDGVHALNNKLQSALNPHVHWKREKNFGSVVFREGDKVMQIRNDYQIEWKRYASDGTYEEGEGIFNGDMGYIDRIEADSGNVVVAFDDGRVVEYSGAELEDLMSSYAISIHKSQGCEFPCVVIPVSFGSPFLYNRNLLYTAVTRAKKLVVLVGTDSAVENMVRNINSSRRYSMLAHRIRSEMQKEELF